MTQPNPQTPPIIPDAATLAQLETDAAHFAREAGAILLRYFRTNVEIEYKGSGKSDPVSVVDRESEQYLHAAIHERYPGHSILGEEGNNLDGADPDYLWVLDPLDGTTNFLNRLPFFAVSVGVLYRGMPIVGAVFVPTSGLLEQGVYHAHLGGGCFFEGHRVHVARDATPQADHLSGLPGGYWRRLRFSGDVRNHHGEVRTLGSIAVELALTADGTLQYSVFGAPKIWDVAGGVLLVREAGGIPLTHPDRTKPWAPLERFEPGAGGATAAGYQNWRGAIVAGNAEMAWNVATHMYGAPRPGEFAKPVINALKWAQQQLRLFR
ncbi:MAG: inositol monophosphatase [Dehalococcoidia bacterium]|nr:inositol monophosphatase [Dehalococcoidia bacterium]